MTKNIKDEIIMEHKNINEIWEKYNPCSDDYDKEILQNRKIYRENHKKEFVKWSSTRKWIHETPEMAGINTTLKKGDIVVYTNDYGAKFAPLEVMGFCRIEYLHGNCVFLNTDCYWMPVKIDSLKKLIIISNKKN